MEGIEIMYAKFEDIQKHLKAGIHHVKGYEPDTESITFYCNDGYAVTLYHDQDCCETVKLENDDGLVNGEDIFTGCEWCNVSMSKMAGEENEYGDEQWTFYLFQTNKGYDTMRWYGESNGYYSIEVAYDINEWNSEMLVRKKKKEKPKFIETYFGQKKDLQNAMDTLMDFCVESECNTCPFYIESEQSCIFVLGDEPWQWNTYDTPLSDEEKE